MPAIKYCTNPEHNGTGGLPATSEFFNSDPSQADGLSVECIECGMFAVARQQAEAQRVAFKNIVANNTGSPHAADLAAEALEQGGGISGIVSRFWQDYAASQIGSNTRLNYHRELWRLIQENTKQGYADKPVKDMDDVELAKFLVSEGQNVLTRLAGETKDGAPA